MPDFTVRSGGETQYIDGEEFEDDGNAKVKFYLTDVDDKERVGITNEICKRFNTYRGQGKVNFYAD